MRNISYCFLASSLLGAALVAQEQVISVPGTAAQVRLWSTAGVTQSAVSRDGGQSWIPMPAVDTRLALRYAGFDPKAGDPPIPAALRSLPHNRLFAVQMVTDAIQEYEVALQRLGAEVSYYVPNQAYLVRMSRALAVQVEAQPFVREVAEFHPAYRLEPELVAAVRSGEPMPTSRYVIMMVDKRVDTDPLVATIRALGGEMNSFGGGILVEATLTREQLMQVANLDQVLWIERWSAPETDIDQARIQAGVNYVESAAGIDGKGVTGHVMEGLYAHVEFGARAPYRTAATGITYTAGTGHGTNTAGEIYAQGLSALYKGLLPYAQCYFTDYSPWFNNNPPTRYNLTTPLVDPTKTYKCMIQTASWGHPQTTVYGLRSAEMDDIIFDTDLFVTQSQSNLASTSSRPQAWAKNMCSVGGFNHFNNSSATDDCWCNTGSTGPANDGRVSPSFAAYYDAIGTTSNTTSYTTGFGGTSGATPIINGLGGCTVQMFTDGLFGYPGVTWQNRFGARPHFTTVKCLMAATSRPLPLTKATRVQQGWGFPNLQDMYDLRDQMLVLNEEDVLQQGQSRTYYVFVKPQTTELRASMHYSDPETPPNYTSPHRINSVDLMVTAPNGSIYWGNNGLGVAQGSVSTSGGVANDKDTFEHVWLQNPSSGVYAVTLSATTLRGDGHVETQGVNDVDPALVVRGIGGGRDKSGMKLDLISNAAGQFDVSLTSVPAGMVGGRTLFSTATTRHPSLGNLFGLEADALALSILGFPPSDGNVFAFTGTTNPGLYPNATYVFPGAIAVAVKGMTFDAVAFVYDNAGAILAVSNVDRVTVM